MVGKELNEKHAVGRGKSLKMSDSIVNGATRAT
jgi:hypothetical protein